VGAIIEDDAARSDDRASVDSNADRFDAAAARALQERAKSGTDMVNAAIFRQRFGFVEMS